MNESLVAELGRLVDSLGVEAGRVKPDTLAGLAEKLAKFFGVKPDEVAIDRKSTRLNSSHIQKSRMPSSA